MLLGLYPFTRSQFFDNDGKPLTGGFIYAYASGTDTPATLFQDGYGLDPHEWPVVLDDAGSEKIYMAPLAYKIVIKNQFGELIEERDPVYSNGFVGGSSETGSWAVVDNYDALRNLTQQVDAVLVLGRNTPNDGGSGIFILDVDENGVDDDGVVLVRATTDRYVRQLNGYIEPAWFGAVYGQALDNSVALNAACEAGITYGLPVNISGSLFFSSNFIVKPGARININGAVTSPVGISFKFKTGSTLLSAYKNAFSQNIQPIFDSGVCDALRVSWFGGGIDQILPSTTFNYGLIVDKDVNITSDTTIPSNFEVDFVGGSKFVVKSTADVIINNLVYNGTGLIVLYQDKSYIKNVQIGQSYCYLEWFGGVAGTALDTDNGIAFKAAVAHGKIYLISDATKFYNIPSGTYSNTTGLVMLGNYVPNNSTVNDLVPSTMRLAEGANLSTTKMTLTSLKILGSGSVTATESTLSDVIIAASVAYSTGMSKINDSGNVDPNYVAVGTYGKIIRTTDANGTWSPITTPINVNISSIAKGSKLYVLVGQNGLIETSQDSITWTQRTSNITSNLNEVKWISAVSKFIAVGENGYVLTSTDGITWNNVQTALSSIKSVAYFDGKYVIVGGEGKIYTSPDLLTWTQKVVTGSNGTLYSVDCSSTVLTIVGYNGVVVTSTDTVNYTIRQTSTFNSILNVKFYADSNIWVAIGVNGLLMTSSDGLNFIIVNTYTDINDSINGQCKSNGQYVFSCSSGYVLTSFDLITFKVNQPVNSQSLSAVASTASLVLAIGDAGAISYSVDGVNYTAITPVTSQNLNRINKIGSNYFIVGNAGTYLISANGLDWTVKTAGTADLYDIVANADNTLYVLVGEGGYVASSTDATATVPVWTAGTSGIATDINQVFFNSASTDKKYLAIGASGRILSSANGTVWTINDYKSNGILSNGTIKLIYGDDGLVLTSTDGITWTERVSGTAQSLYAGVHNGSLFVLAGVNGAIVTSTDGVTWSTRTSGTTQTISSLDWNGSLFVGVGTAGLTIRSSDGINWTVTLSTNTITFHKVRWINSLWVAVGTYGVGGTIQTSPDGYTWSGQTAGTTETIYDIAWDGSKYIYVASAGVINYGAMGSWTAAENDGVTATLYGIYRDASGLMIAVGANGTMLGSSNGTKFTTITSVVGKDLHSVVKIGSEYFMNGSDFVILKSAELLIWKAYINNPADENLVGMFDGTNYAIITQDTVLSLTYNHLLYSKDGIVWLAVNNEQTQMANIGKIGSDYTLYGYADLAQTYTSSDIAATTWNKNIINSVADTIVSITVATINGNSLVVYFTADGAAITGTTGTGLLTATKISLKNVISGMKIVNTLAGDVSTSQLYDISYIGRTTDTTISDFTGTLNGPVNRTDITFVQSVGIASDITVSDSKMTNKSGKKFDVFNLASTVASLVLNNCTIKSLGSMVVYSENTSLKVVIEGGVIWGGNATALTNGYSKIYLNNVFDEAGDKVDNISAYSLDGDVLASDLVTHMASDNLSSALTHWYHTQKANLAIDAGSIKVNTAIVLSADLNSTSSLRYRWGNTALRFLKNFGGRIKTTVQFPTGTDKDVQAKTKIKAQLYIPEYTVTCYDYDTLVYTGKVNNSYLVGKTVSMGSSVDSAKLVNHTNVWSGRQDMLYGAMVFGSRNDRYDKNGVVDVYGDVSYQPASSSVLLGHDFESGSFSGGTVSGDVSHEVYVVLTSAEDVLLPVGTTIKVELELAIPATMGIFNKFYNVDNDYTLDTVSGIEKVYLHYKGIEDNTFKVAIVKNALSETKSENAYLSITNATVTDPITHVTTYYQVPDSYTWKHEHVPGYPEGIDYYYRQYLQYMKPETLLEFSFGEIGYDFEITINGLYNATMPAKSFGGAQSSVIGINDVQVSGTSGTIGGIYFIHSIWKHVKLLNMAFFDQIDKVITKRYYNGLS